MLIQQRLIDKVREVCRADERMDAALMYGSFGSGEADAHSDVEFWLFFLPQWQGQVDPRQSCAQLAPLTHLVRNEFGAYVAFFPAWYAVSSTSPAPTTCRRCGPGPPAMRRPTG